MTPELAASAAAVVPAVRLGASRPLRGMAYGLGQPAVLAEIFVSRAARGPFDALDQAMLAFVETPFDEEVGASQDAARSLVRRIHHWHAAMQREADVPVFGPCFTDTLRGATSDDAVAMMLAVPCARPEATAAALRWVVDAVATLLGCAAPASEIERLRAAFAEAARALRPAAVRGVNSIHFLAAAHRLGMAVTELSPGTHSVGLGRLARRLNSSVTDATGLIAAGLAQDKMHTAMVLGRLGFPVPVHVRVGSEQEAVEAARRLGYPVVVKPADRDGGRGVFAGLWNDEVLRGAWREAARLSRRVLVEKHFDGEDYRFTVVHGEVVKIMHRVPGGVTGDGLADVATLVERVKARESHRRAFRREGKWRLSLDREAMELLGEQGLDGGSVPPAGRFVRLRRKSNISAGGEHALVPLEAVHPDNADLAIRATAAIGLDIAGIDLILPDVGRAWHETGAIVCEVNAKPQIGRRDTPEIYADILRRLVSGDGSVPVHLLVVRGEAQDGHASFAARNARRLGCNAFSCPAGAWVEGRRTVWRPADAFAAAQAMLLDGRVASALVCMTLGDVLRSGLPAARLAGVLLAAEVADAGAAAQRRSLLRMLEGHGGTVRVVRDARENEER